MPSREPSPYLRTTHPDPGFHSCRCCGLPFKIGEMIIRRHHKRNYHEACYYVVGLYFPKIPWGWLLKGEGTDLDLNLLIGSCFGEDHNLIAKEEAG